MANATQFNNTAFVRLGGHPVNSRLNHAKTLDIDIESLFYFILGMDILVMTLILTGWSGVLILTLLRWTSHVFPVLFQTHPFIMILEWSSIRKPIHYFVTFV